MAKRHFLLLVTTLAVAGLIVTACAQTEAQQQTHHPGAQATATAGPSDGAVPLGPTSPATAGMASMPDMDRQMKAMQDMHVRMAAATTPAEREALMPENSKLMREGMAMMRSMGQMQSMEGMRASGEMPADMGARMQLMENRMEVMEKRTEVMEKRMEMMQSMMQMLMYRLPFPPGTK